MTTETAHPTFAPRSPATAPAAPARPRSEGEVTIPIAESFRYVHEPLPSGDGSIPFLGEDAVTTSIRDHITHSNGGSFLVTGFRGVGKTTAVGRVLEDLRAEHSDEVGFLPIIINAARPISPAELLFEIVRRLFEALVDQRILETLPPDVQRALVLAYTRTSLSFKETQGSAVERTRGLELGGIGGASVLRLVSPKLSFSRKATDSLATEAAFLAYSVADVEHDLQRIVELLRQPYPRSARLGNRILRRLRLRGAPRSGWQHHLIVILDELDKLTAAAGTPDALEPLLTAMKNLLTMRGVHFLFVGGPDLHDAALRHKRRGSSVYESAFGWQTYVACTWEAPGRLLNRLVGPDACENQELAEFRDYLAFKARGIPRLLLLEFNEFVAWEGNQPQLRFTEFDRERIRFYASLERVVSELFSKPRDDGFFSVPIDEDRRRLTAYYVTDWILGRGGDEFTVDQIISLEGDMDPLLKVSEKRARRIVEHLVLRNIVEHVREESASKTIIGDVARAQADVYRLARDELRQLVNFARSNERERGELFAGAPSATRIELEGVGRTGRARSLGGSLVESERYELLEEIGRGGMGVVYRARDTRLDRDVAVKLVPPFLREDPNMLKRIRREAEIAALLRHPNVVATYDVFQEEDGSFGIVMEFVQGRGLRSLIESRELTTEKAIRIALQLLDALEYVDGLGIFRIDLKPENIILVDEQRAVVLDFGVAKLRAAARSDRLTETGTAVGTPAYMSPEAATGKAIDIRSDIYTLGLILIEMITGEQVKSQEDPVAVLYATVFEDVDLAGLHVSDELHAAIGRAVARDPGERFAKPSEMAQALRDTPEGKRRRPNRAAASRR